MPVEFNEKQVEGLDKLLNDKSNPLHERFRALFTLRNLPCQKSIDAIAKCFADDSVLLKHELAYCLGQMKDPYANKILREVLADVSENPMVRHEAAEALGAIGSQESLKFLESFLIDDSMVVVETCRIAIDKIKYEMENKSHDGTLPNPYHSVDPAPPCKNEGTESLLERLMNTKLELFDRYRAMFALRNKGDEQSVLALTKGFADKSALFRHEIAYVLGQMSHPASVPALIKVLQNDSEHEMVRHECAEALGSIATEETLPVLEKYKKDSERVVRESCIVALDMYQYENSGDFQYANALSKV